MKILRYAIIVLVLCAGAVSVALAQEVSCDELRAGTKTQAIACNNATGDAKYETCRIYGVLAGEMMKRNCPDIPVVSSTGMSGQPGQGASGKSTGSAAVGDVTIENPLGEVNSLQDIFKFLSSQLMLLIIPIAVALYVYAGILYLYAAYEGKSDSITKAKNVLWYTTIGLVIIFIGGGFVDLIRSVLESSAERGGPPSSQIQGGPVGQPNPFLPDGGDTFELVPKRSTPPVFTPGPAGASCSTSADCASGYTCGSFGVCVKQ